MMMDTVEARLWCARAMLALQEPESLFSYYAFVAGSCIILAPAAWIRQFFSLCQIGLYTNIHSSRLAKQVFGVTRSNCHIIGLSNEIFNKPVG